MVIQRENCVYGSPQVEVLELYVEGVLCSSNEIVDQPVGGWDEE